MVDLLVQKASSFDIVDKESLLKGRDQYSLPPWTYCLSIIASLLGNLYRK
jgi:hypothetical protein